MRTSKRGQEELRGYESFSAATYKDIAGKPTIGYGHLVRPGEGFATLTKQAAEELFQKDLLPAERVVTHCVRVPLTQDQFDVLVSCTFNIGGTAFAESTLLTLLNAGDYKAASLQLLRWNKATNPKTGKLEISQGLTNRRAKEQARFLNGE